MTAVIDSSPLIVLGKARALGLQVTGVLGVLVEAKYRGVVSSVRPILAAVSGEGFWLSESLRRTVLDAVGE